MSRHDHLIQLIRYTESAADGIHVEESQRTEEERIFMGKTGLEI